MCFWKDTLKPLFPCCFFPPFKLMNFGIKDFWLGPHFIRESTDIITHSTHKHIHASLGWIHTHLFCSSVTLVFYFCCCCCRNACPIINDSYNLLPKTLNHNLFSINIHIILHYITLYYITLHCSDRWKDNKTDMVLFFSLTAS